MKVKTTPGLQYTVGVLAYMYSRPKTWIISGKWDKMSLCWSFWTTGGRGGGAGWGAAVCCRALVPCRNRSVARLLDILIPRWTLEKAKRVWVKLRRVSNQMRVGPMLHIFASSHQRRGHWASHPHSRSLALTVSVLSSVNLSLTGAPRFMFLQIPCGRGWGLGSVCNSGRKVIFKVSDVFSVLFLLLMECIWVVFSETIELYSCVKIPGLGSHQYFSSSCPMRLTLLLLFHPTSWFPFPITHLTLAALLCA